MPTSPRSFARRFAIATLACATLALPACTSREFQTSSLTTEAQVEKDAGQYWKREGWWKLPADASRVVITEFTVEYVTATGTADQSFGLVRMAQIAGMGKKEFAYPEDTKQSLPDRLYDQYVAALRDKGFEVVPTETLRATEGYRGLEQRAEGDTTRASQSQGVVYKQSVWQKGQMYSANGLLARDDSWFKNIGNAMREVEAIGQADADTGLRVRVKVGVDGKGRACLYPGSTVFVTAGVHDAAGVQSDRDPSYVAKTSGLMVSKQTLYFSEPIVDGKSFKAFKGDVYEVQGPPLTDAVTEVFPTFARLNVAAMR
jgi:hypothetical protein